MLKRIKHEFDKRLLKKILITTTVSPSAINYLTGSDALPFTRVSFSRDA